MKNMLYLFLFFLLFACKEKHPYPRIIMSECDNVVRVNSKEMLYFSEYSFLTGNIDKDTEFGNKKNDELANQNKLFKRIYPDTLLPNYNLKIIVDTTYHIYANGFEYTKIPAPKNLFKAELINGKIPTSQQLKSLKKEFFKHSDKIFKQKKDFLECYPLLILNKNKDTIITRFKFIQEAKDVDGKWKPFEVYYNFGGCGNPEIWHYKLASNKYMIYPIIKYNGDFKTKIRVKVYNKGNVYYSNEIEGFINQSQFNKFSLKKEFEESNPDYNFNESSKVLFLDKRK